jgi:O-antigen/teichoic acid export membrane protein
LKRWSLPSLGRNVLANLLGGGWAALMGFAFVPVYLHYIGAKGYGLVGVFTTITASLAIFDGGLGASVGRELARASIADADEKRRARDLTYSVELLLWIQALLFGAALTILAPLLSTHWLRLSGPEWEMATRCIRLMGLALAFQWPVNYYMCCLVGLEQQVRLNTLQAVLATIRFPGAAIWLVLVAPHTEGFFVWQVLSWFLVVAATRFVLHRSLPHSEVAPEVSLSKVRELGQFGLRLTIVNALNILIYQIDKVIAARMLPLVEFGQYSLAWTLGVQLYRLTTSVYNGVQPRINQLAASNDAQGFSSVYRWGSQAMALLLFPTTFAVVVFGREFVGLWTGDWVLASEMRWVLAFVVLGITLQSLLYMPQSIPVARGDLRPNIAAGVLTLSLLTPLVFWGARHYGAFGAALAYMSVNGALLCTVGCCVQFAYLRSEFRSWLLGGLLLPATVSAALFWLARLLLPELPTGRAAGIAVLVLTGLVNLVGVALSLRQYRRWQSG